MLLESPAYVKTSADSRLTFAGLPAIALATDIRLFLESPAFTKVSADSRLTFAGLPAIALATAIRLFLESPAYVKTSADSRLTFAGLPAIALATAGSELYLFVTTQFSDNLLYCFTIKKYYSSLGFLLCRMNNLACLSSMILSQKKG